MGVYVEGCNGKGYPNLNPNPPGSRPQDCMVPMTQAVMAKATPTLTLTLTLTLTPTLTLTLTLILTLTLP